MEKLLKPYDKEHMKMAMLKHEETFREQVSELHRLYQTQKMLMKNISSISPNGKSKEMWISNIGTSLNPAKDHRETRQQRRQKFDLELPAEEYVSDDIDGDGVLEVEDEREIELTLGLASYHRRGKANTPLLTSDSGPSFSSSSSGSCHWRKTRWETSHHSTDTRRDIGQKWELVEVPESNSKFLSGIKNTSSDAEEQLRQDRLNQPPWLFQVLSLKMT